MERLFQYLTESCLIKTFPSPKRNVDKTIDVIRKTINEIKEIKDPKFKRAMHGLANAKLFLDDYKQVFLFICDYLDGLCSDMDSVKNKGFEVAKIFEKIINIISYPKDLKDAFSRTSIIKDLYTTNGDTALGKQMVDDVLMFWNDICKLSTGKKWMQ